LWPVLALLTAVLLWGGSFAAMRVALRVLNPWSMMWVRMAVGVALLAPFTAGRLPRDLRASYRKGDWKLLVLLVATEPCLYFLLESNALRFTTASQAGVIVATAPLLVALGAWLFLRERMSAAGAVGLAVVGQHPPVGVVDRLGQAGLELLVHLWRDAGRQHLRAVPGQAQEDLGYLFGGLALGVDHLGEAGAQGAVVVEVGEGFDGFVRVKFELLEGLVDAGPPAADLFQD